MPLFDAYVMVDWSGADRRRAGRQDCIWIAHGPAAAAAPITVSPPSRTEAEQIIRRQLQPIVAANKGRVLLCADFGYGYPAGFASLLAKSFSGKLPPWPSSGSICATTCRMTAEQSQANGRRTAAIASRSPAQSTPQYRALLRTVHSGVFSNPVVTLVSRKKSRRTRSSAPVELSLRFE